MTHGEVGNGWAGCISHEVDFGPVFNNLFFGVVILVPEETHVRSLMVGDCYLMEHILDVRSDSIGMAAKSKKYSPE